MSKALTKKEIRSFQLDMLAVLILPCVSAWYFYGARAVALIAASIASAALCEGVGRKILKQEQTLGDLSAVVTAIVIALVLPANAPLWLPAVGSGFAVICAKLPFGRLETLPFSPAAAGIAFLTICFPDLIFDYPQISAPTAALTGSAGSSLGLMLSQNTAISLSSVKAIDIMTGNYPGPMGAGCIIVLLGSALYMLIRRTRLFIGVAGFITGAALMAICFPRVTNLFASLVLELSAGYMLFAALFLITELGTQPKAPLSKLLYGFFGGIICMLMRRFGAFEEGAAFGILIIDAVWPVIDKYAVSKLLKTGSPEKEAAK